MKKREKRLKGDHKHTCAKCGHEWECLEFTHKECVGKGVFRAILVNKDGPWCGLCLHLEMARRHAELRGLRLEVELKKTGSAG